jgi:hypothetical protein
VDGIGPVLELGTLAAGLMASLPALNRYWREDRTGFVKTLSLMAVYLVYGAAGIGITIALVTGPSPPDKAVALAAFLLTWILYGALWLTRSVPRHTPLPRWISEGFGLVDAVLIAISLAGLVYFL